MKEKIKKKPSTTYAILALIGVLAITVGGTAILKAPV